MKNFDISTDSTCDFYANEIQENGLFFLPLTYTLSDKGVITEHKDEFKDYSEYIDYYGKLRSGIISKTSMNNPAIHEAHFRNMAKKGVKSAVHFTISYGLCHTVDVARAAVANVQKDYPDFNCLCVESDTTTIGQGFLVRIAIDMQKKGKTAQETFDYVESVKGQMQHFIIADDLMYLKRGGRLSAASAAIGTMLNVKPIIIFNKEGKLVTYKKNRGLKRTLTAIADEYANYTVNADYPQVYIGHTDNIPAAEFLQKQLKDKYGVNAIIRMIGPVIGSHLGPNAVAYLFLSNEERPM